MIVRNDDIRQINKMLEIFPVVALLGARQCGKTTLAKGFPFQHYFDLENPRDLARLAEPQLALESLRGLIVIDEIQRIPELFPLLRFLVDQNRDQKYLILGSASRDLIRQSSESLAGRIGYYYLGGFNLNDVGPQNLQKLWIQGAFPRSYLQESSPKSMLWRREYITTFLEKDIPQLGISIPSHTLRRFWTMLSHYHAQVMNYSEIGRSFGMSDKTIRHYVDTLEGTFMLRLLQPWFANVGKRVVKHPKVYIRDSGLFHTLMSIETHEDLLSHPKLGASWEGFALDLVCSKLQHRVKDVYFWSTHSGAEVDLFWQANGKDWAIEFKYMDAPKLTRSMVSACEDLDLNHLWIIYPGNATYSLAENMTVCPLTFFYHQDLLGED